MSELYDDQYSFGKVVENAYVVIHRTLDDLPYTQEFDALHGMVARSFRSASKRDVIHHLFNARKSKRLPALGVEGSPAPILTEDAKKLLIGIVEKAVGTIGARDQLPYTEKFDAVALEFNRRGDEQLASHDLWRAISHLSKSPNDRPD